MVEISELSGSSAVSRYSRLKSELLRCIDEMLAIEAIRGCPCEELREKIEKKHI